MFFSFIQFCRLKFFTSIIYTNQDELLLVVFVSERAVLYCLWYLSKVSPNSSLITVSKCSNSRLMFWFSLSKLLWAESIFSVSISPYWKNFVFEKLNIKNNLVYLFTSTFLKLFLEFLECPSPPGQGLVHRTQDPPEAQQWKPLIIHKSKVQVWIPESLFPKS